MARKLIILTILYTALIGELIEAQKCTMGNLRSVLEDDSRLYPLYCFKENELKTVCTDSGTWTEISARVACRQLGYSGFIAKGNGCPGNVTKDIDSIQLSRECKEEDRIQECGGVSEHNCSCDSLAWLSCRPDCIDGDIRLVNGSVGSGRVEVCTKGLWGTVYSKNSLLAPVICSQLGFISQEARIVPGSIFSTDFSVPINNCTLESDDRLRCTEVIDAFQYDHSKDLGVVCRTHKQLYTELLDQCSNKNSPTSSQCVDVTGSVGAPGHHTAVQALGAITGILMALIVAMVIGWIITCVIMRKPIAERKMQQSGSQAELLESNLSYGRTQLYSRSANILTASDSASEDAYLSSYSTEPGTESSQTNTAPPAPNVTHKVDNDSSGAVYSVVTNEGSGPRMSSYEYNLQPHTGTQYAQVSIGPPQEGYAKLRGRLMADPNDKYDTLVHSGDKPHDFSQKSEYSKLNEGERQGQNEQSPIN